MRNFRQFVAVVVVAVPLVAIAEPPAASPAQLDRWVADLGADDFRVREAATRELKRSPAAAPKLRVAARSSDNEVAARATEILNSFDPLFREQALRRIAAAVKRREVDVVAEQIVRFPCPSGAEPPDLWQTGLDLAWVARDDYAKRYKASEIDTSDKIPPFRVISEWTKQYKAPILRPDVGKVDVENSYLYRGGPLQIGVDANVRVLASNGVIDTRLLLGCIYLTTDRVDVNFERGTCAVQAVVMSPSDVRFRTERKTKFTDGNSIILVSCGDIHAPLSLSGSVILAKGDVYIPDAPGVRLYSTTIRAGGKIHLPAKYKSDALDMKENVADPTAPFTFFSLARVGLTVAAGEGGVRVAKIDQKSPFAAAGVAAGDVIVAVDDAKVGTPDDLKKRVRAGVARGDAEVRVRTGATVRDLLVRFPE